MLCRGGVGEREPPMLGPQAQGRGTFFPPAQACHTLPGFSHQTQDGGPGYGGCSNSQNGLSSHSGHRPENHILLGLSTPQVWKVLTPGKRRSAPGQGRCLGGHDYCLIESSLASSSPLSIGWHGNDLIVIGNFLLW